MVVRTYTFWDSTELRNEAIFFSVHLSVPRKQTFLNTVNPHQSLHFGPSENVWIFNQITKAKRPIYTEIIHFIPKNSVQISDISDLEVSD